jgi:hypothetical protein
VAVNQFIFKWSHNFKNIGSSKYQHINESFDYRLIANY